MLALSIKTFGLLTVFDSMLNVKRADFFFLFLLAATCMTSSSSSIYKYSGKPVGLDVTACEAWVPTILQAALCTASACLQCLV